jgi:RNA polymerase sigma-70 factor (ECF subfamily)
MDQREKIVRENLPTLLRICTAILGDPMEAQDAVQDTFLKAFYARSPFRGDGKVSTWLTRIAIRTCMDRLRKINRRREAPEEEAAQIHDPNATPLDRELARQMVRRALEVLSPKEQVVVKLRFGIQCQIEEISKMLHCSPSTAKTYLRRALRKMAKALEKDHP